MSVRSFNLAAASTMLSMSCHNPILPEYCTMNLFCSPSFSSIRVFSTGIGSVAGNKLQCGM